MTNIIDLPYLSGGFPERPPHEVVRDNIILTIDRLLSGDRRIVFVEGPPGTGKTTVLAQFARTRPQFAISAFIKHSTKLGFDPEVIRFDLSRQLSWICDKKVLHDPSETTDEYFRLLYLKLSRLVRTENKRFYFVMDGLDELTEPQNSFKELILDLLPPPGMQGFYYLFSGDPKEYPSQFLSAPTGPFPIPPFTSGETSEYLNEFKLEPHEVDEVHKLTNGVPGHLASIRRIAETPERLREMLPVLPEHLPGLFELEWKKTANLSDPERKLIAIIAHELAPQTPQHLSAYTGIAEPDINVLIERLQFLTFKAGVITFISEAFRKFAADKLKHMVSEVDSIIISSFLKSPDTVAAVSSLPFYFQRAGKHEQLLEYMTPSRVQLLLENSQTSVPIQEQLDLGIQTAKQTKRDVDLVKFALLRSVLSDVNRPEAYRAEIAAQVALQNDAVALSIAQRCVLKEDRLQLLCIIANEFHRRRKGSVPPELLDQIRQTYAQIDPSALGMKAVNVAADLFAASPALAIEMIDNSTPVSRRESGVDWAFAKLSLVALQQREGVDEREEHIAEIRKRIKDPMVRDLANSAQLLLADYSALQVLTEVEKIEKSADRIYLLRQWCVVNRERKDAACVIRYALDLIIKTTDFSPNAKLYRELSTPLPNIEKDDDRRALITYLSSQLPPIKTVGPTEEYVRVMLTLAAAEARTDWNLVRSRATDAYYEISSVHDSATKALCLARLRVWLRKNDPAQDLEKRDGLHTLVATELKNEIENVLASTADHFAATEGILRTMAEAFPQEVLSTAYRLNTEGRRDIALLEIAKVLAKGLLGKEQVDALNDLLEKFGDADICDDCTHLILRGLSKNKVFCGSHMPLLESLFQRSMLIRDSAERAESLALVLICLKRTGATGFSAPEELIKTAIFGSLESFDIGWIRVDLGFELARTLAEEYPDLARRILELTQCLRAQNLLEGGSLGQTLINSLRLAIRAFSGLIPKGIDCEDDLQQIRRLLRQIPSLVIKCQLWTDIALRYFSASKIDKGKHIVASEILPLLDSFDPTDQFVYSMAVMYAAPALFFSHPGTALNRLESLQRTDRDTALSSVASFIFRKTPLSEPYESTELGAHRLSYEEALDLCLLLEHLEKDTEIYEIICKLSATLRHRTFGGRFTRQQTAEIQKRLSLIVDKKLPSARYIQHSGFQLLSRAQIAHMVKTKAHDPIWTKLIMEAKKVGNVADQVYCLSTLINLVPANDGKRIYQLMNDAASLLPNIPVDSDRISHYEDLVGATKGIDIAFAKNLIQQAGKELAKSNEDEMDTTTRRLIDLAHRCDPKLATSLASELDSDPARITERKKKLGKEQLRLIELRNEMIEPEKKEDELFKYKPSEIAQTAWQLLGSLVAGRVPDLDPREIRPYLTVASRIAMDDSYPIFAWAIENFVRRYAKTDQAQSHLRPLFDTILFVAELSAWFASEQNQRDKGVVNSPSLTDSVVVHWDEREKVLEKVSGWIRDTKITRLLICDPYFSVDDLDFIRLIRDENRECEVAILASLAKQNLGPFGHSLDQLYRNEWRFKISDSDAGPTMLCFVGAAGAPERDAFPIHDRWWVSETSGLRIGTSLNSLGLGRISEISVLSPEEAKTCKEDIERFLVFRERSYKGERLTYLSFDL